MGYLLASAISFALRASLCFFTIETTPIFANDAIEWIFGQILSIYTVLRLIAYFIVGNLFKYKRGDMPILGVALYGLVHTSLVFICWGILALLTVLNVLPV